MRHPARTVLFAVLAAAPPQALAQPASKTDEREIRTVLEQQQQAWNRGDIEAFMEGYDRSDTLVFTSGGTVQRGWQATLARYRKSYPDRQAMGRLRFSDLEITRLGVAGAAVLGRWALERASDRPHGVFTLVLRKTRGGWKIIHDHTSSAR